MSGLEVGSRKGEAGRGKLADAEVEAKPRVRVILFHSTQLFMSATTKHPVTG